ncbi:hypothetical protein V5799_029204 [Amblyomma americanum]|uniref:Uncharacterized protein n=1 Tax=Amblyomma americanum TaxID=6943 RepID=A0AAQ4ERV1_AMBAM
MRIWTQGQRERPSKGHWISWSALDTKAGSAGVRDPTRRRRLVFSWLRRVLYVTVSLLVEMAAAVLFRLEGSTDETARRTTSSSIFEEELVTPPGPSFLPFFGRDTPSSPAVSLYRARTEGRFMGDVVHDPVTTAGSLYLNAAFENSVSRDTEIVNLICLVSGEPPQLEEMDCIENSRLRECSRCRRCDAGVHCCYSLGKDKKLKNGNRLRAVAENATQARPTSEGRRAASQLLGVLADDAAWRRLATRSDRIKFARAVIRAVQVSKFDGVRVLAPWRERSARGLYDFVVGLAADVAARLQKENYSFGFFLPQGLSESDRFTTQPKKILNTRHSVLFYPDFSVFWKTAAAARWPLPQEARGRSSNETTVNETDSKSDSFACYLFAPPAAASLRLGEHCYPLKSQSVALEVASTFLTANNLCHLWNASGKTSVHNYSTYACYGRQAAFYQSSPQARSFAIDVLAHTPSSTCAGSISSNSYIEDGLRECRKTSAGSEEA